MEPPEKVFAEYCFMKEINIDRCDLTTSKELSKWMTGLMNASGGLIVLHCSKPHSDKKRDHWLMDFKHHVTSKWIPNSLYRSLVIPRYRMIREQLLLVFFVSKSPTLVTFRNNAYCRHAAGVEPITDPEDIQKLQDGRGETPNTHKPNSQLKRLLKGKGGFKLNDEIPLDYCESNTMEFKHYHMKDNSELTSFCASELSSRLDRDNEMLKNISAFANTEGGSLVIGIEESGKFPVVKGFRISDNQTTEEKELTSHIEMKLQECIWNTNQEGNHWSIFYHDVIEGDEVTRKVIEICVHRVPGGMFYKAPQCFKVDKEGRCKEFNGFDTLGNNANSINVEGRDLAPKDRLDRHVTTGIVRHKGTPVARHENTPVNIVRLVRDDSSFAINDTKITKSFKQSQSVYKADINTVNLSLRDCCIQDMAKHLMTLRPRKAWFPSKRTMHRKLSGICHFRKIRRYINKQKWRGIASVITEQGISNRCDLLIICKHGPPKLICCFPENESSDEEKLENALRLGRELKAQFLNSAANASYLPLNFHFDIQILKVHPNGPITVVWDSQMQQPVVYPGTKSLSYIVACNGLAEMLLKTETTILGCCGQILTDHLTAEQARILLERKEQILIVRGRSGTGKTVVALNVVHELKERRNCTAKDVLYICSNQGVEAYIKSQNLCTVWVLQHSNSLSQEQKSLLQTFKLIVVDDIHGIRLDRRWKENSQDIYRLLFAFASMNKVEIALFFDPYQDFQNRLPKHFDEELREVALNCTEGGEVLLPQQVQIYTLDKRIRNSREINRFMQANQNQANTPETFTCLNEQEGDDVTYAYIGNTLGETASTINAILDRLSQRYNKASTVILCDDDEQLTSLRSRLRERFNRKLQDGKTFPITNTVICKFEEFGGLEADVILFLLPPNWGLEHVGKWKYVYCVSSRAILKLEFLLPWNAKKIKDKRLQTLHQLLELFKQVGAYIKLFSELLRKNFVIQKVKPHDH